MNGPALPNIFATSTHSYGYLIILQVPCMISVAQGMPFNLSQFHIVNPNDRFKYIDRSEGNHFQNPDEWKFHDNFYVYNFQILICGWICLVGLIYGYIWENHCSGLFKCIGISILKSKNPQHQYVGYLNFDIPEALMW